MPRRAVLLLELICCALCACNAAEQHSTIPEPDAGDVIDTVSELDSETESDGDAGEPVDPGTLVEWVAVPGGEYWMGDDGLPESSPEHLVSLPAFEMTRTEITLSQYEACVMYSGCDEVPHEESIGIVPACNSGDGDHPANCVTFDNAMYFCNWVGGTVPSEAQWEYAARDLGASVLYPWGDWPATCDWAVMATSPLYPGWGCGAGETLPVCFIPGGNTAQGLCDMAGSVWEWTRDSWHDDYTGAPDDGSVWGGDPLANRVLRGGGFTNMDPLYLRSAFRYEFNSSLVSAALGFRCVRDPQ